MDWLCFFFFFFFSSRRRHTRCSRDWSSDVCSSDLLKHARGPAYDIVFLDPPYQTRDAQRVLPSLGGDAIIHPHGVVVVEHFHKTHLVDRIGHLALVKTYRYGDTCLSVYQRDRAEASA